MKTKFEWDDIYRSNDKIPTANGIYAWYYAPKLSEKDIEEMYAALKEKASNSEKRDITSNFLNEHLFKFYSENPYDVLISGALKPTYRGLLQHEDNVPKSLTDKILSNEAHLHDLKRILETVDETFLSPIYIGMATNLKDRINQHKEKIIQLKDNSHFNISQIGSEKSEDDRRDNNFASRIYSKSYISSHMFVICHSLSSNDGIHNPFENILNRINYPILGRN